MIAEFRCPECGVGVVRGARTTYAIDFRNASYEIPDVELMKCSACGAVFFAPGQSDALQRRAADFARTNMGLVTGAEITAFRRAHALTQAQLERALGAPAKTVARWEIGTVFQSRTVDRFLRLLMAHPALVDELLESALPEARAGRRPPDRGASRRLKKTASG